MADAELEEVLSSLPAAAAYVARHSTRSSSLRRMHPNSLRVLLSTVFLYGALLWRSTSKIDGALSLDSLNIFELIAKVHHALLVYLARKILLFASTTAVLVRFLSLSAVSAPGAAAGFVAAQSLALQDIGQAKVEEWLDQQMDTGAEKAKSVIGDPYMPAPLLRAVEDAVDTFLPDAKRLVLSKTDEIIRGRSIITRAMLPPDAVVIVGARARRLDAAKNSKPFAWRPYVASAWGTATNAPQVAVGAAHSSYRVAFDAGAYIIPSFIANAAPSFLSLPSPNRDVTLTSSVETLMGGGESTADSVLDAMDLDVNVDDTAGNFSQHSRVWQLCLRLRAHVLYVTAPCDKSFWQCLRDPQWIAFSCIGLMPWGIGTLWWLFLFALHEKTDEFQMCNFIVSFMVSKFLGGIGYLVWGAALYYVCATKDVPTCDVAGPRVQSELIDGISFFAQVFLVWLSFFILPLTKPCHAVSHAKDLYLVEDMEKVYEKLGVKAKRGSRLQGMFWYDTLCLVVVTTGLLVAIFVLKQSGWKLRVTLFWLKSVFGLLALPFLVFKIPFISTLLLAVRTTGYDPNGMVVLHVRPPYTPPPKTPAAPSSILAPSASATASSGIVKEVSESAKGAATLSSKSQHPQDDPVVCEPTSSPRARHRKARLLRQGSVDSLLANLSEDEEDEARRFDEDSTQASGEYVEEESDSEISSLDL